MIKIQIKYRPIASFFLAALLIGAFSLKETHHHHEEALICHSDGETHLHGEEYHIEACFICFLSFSPFENHIKHLAISLPDAPVSDNIVLYQAPLTIRSDYSFFLRGPPALS